MNNSNEVNSKLIEPRRKLYVQPHIEIVPLLPKQTVLGTGCYSASSENFGAINSNGCTLNGTPPCNH
jgi:hypothetical protein